METRTVMIFTPDTKSSTSWATEHIQPSDSAETTSQRNLCGNEVGTAESNFREADVLDDLTLPRLTTQTGQ